jgi:adenylate cyclase
MAAKDCVDAQAVNDAVERIILSGVIGPHSRLAALLHYLVQRVLSGHGDHIKAYTIATDVFGRGADFDANSDSIVRVDVRRLRQALEYYYMTAGAVDPIRITIPSGTYKPLVSVHTPSTPIDQPPDLTGPGNRSSQKRTYSYVAAIALYMLTICSVLGYGAWATSQGSVSYVPQTLATFVRDEPRVALAVSNGSSVDAPPELQALNDSLRLRLLTALSRQKTFPVISSANGSGDLQKRGVKVYSLETLFERNGEVLSVVASLRNDEDIQIWGEVITDQVMRADTFTDHVIWSIVTGVRPQLAIDLKPAAQILATTTTGKQAWDLYLASIWTPAQDADGLAREHQSLGYAEQAVLLKPDFGLARAAIAHKLARLSNFDPASDTPENLQKARVNAESGLQLAPNDPDVFNAVGAYHWYVGDLENAERTARRSVELDPFNVFARGLAEVAPFTCSKPSDEVIAKLRDLESLLAEENPLRWMAMYGLAQLSFNAGNEDEALEYIKRANLINSAPLSVLFEASLKHRQGQTEAAIDLLRRHKALWPTLDLGHYSKTIIPRRCQSGDRVEEIKRLYEELATLQVKLD